MQRKRRGLDLMSIEAAVCRCSSKKVFLKISQIFTVWKHLCWSLFLIKLHGLRPSWKGVFLWNLRNLQEHVFLHVLSPLVAASVLLTLSFKLTSHGIMHYLWSADLSKNFSQLIVSIFIFSMCFYQLIVSIFLFSQYFFQ